MHLSDLVLHEKHEEELGRNGRKKGSGLKSTFISMNIDERTGEGEEGKLKRGVARCERVIKRRSEKDARVGSVAARCMVVRVRANIQCCV